MVGVGVVWGGGGEWQGGGGGVYVYDEVYVYVWPARPCGFGVPIGAEDTGVRDVSGGSRVGSVLASGMGIPRLDSRRVFRTAIDGNLSPQIARLLLCVHEALPSRRRCVIGGAIALSDAGYGRHSDRLEVLVGKRLIARFVDSLASRGFTTRMNSSRYAVAYLDEDNREEFAAGREPSLRIEVSEAREALETGAMRTAIPASDFRVDVMLVRPDYLAALKFVRAEPLDLIDFDELIGCGGDGDRITRLVAKSAPARVAAVAARIRKVRNRPKTPFDPRARWLDRHAMQAAWEASEARREARVREGNFK